MLFLAILLAADPIGARSPYIGVVNAVFLDGSVRAIGNSIDSAVWRAVATRDADDISAGFRSDGAL
ncbi:MAG: hypothetical protein ACRDD1_15540 [Planctomycetia bacterium]